MRWALVVPACILFQTGFAWHDTGHMLVAEIARQNLKPEIRKQVDALVSIGATPKTDSMAMAACWADDFKTNQNGLWHYINYHFRPDGKPATEIPLAENVVWAIRWFSETLRNKTAPQNEKADALRFLLHFVGDIHQPLHNVARDTEETPAGDRGGNDFKLVPPADLQPSPRNLHFLWDMAAGAWQPIERPLTGEGQARLTETANGLQTQYPASKFGKQLELYDPEDWAREGLDFAKRKVYGFKTGEAPPSRYLAMVQNESRRLVTLAGYRLAILLNRVLDTPSGPTR